MGGTVSVVGGMEGRAPVLPHCRVTGPEAAKEKNKDINISDKKRLGKLTNINPVTIYLLLNV